MGANRYTGIAFSLVAAATLCVGAGEASAKPKGRGGKGRNKTETVRMVRPADGADANARGTVEVTDARRGMEAVLRLQNLDPRTVYRIVETGTGEVLGTVKTNRKGRATFDLSGGGAPRKGRASSGGAEGDGGDKEPVVPIEDVEGVEVVCETNDETVLECDGLGTVISGEPRFLEGSAFYGDPETGTGMVSMFSYDDGEFSSESFSFVYCPPYAMDEGGFDMPHMFYADTANGDELPLGFTSVQDLAGLDFQVRSADGATVVMEGELPAVEEIAKDPWYGDDWGVWEGEWDGTWDMDGDLPGDEWSDDWSGDWSDWGAWDPAEWMDFGDMGMAQSTGRRGGVRAKGRAEEEEPAPASTFELLIRDPETDEFVKVGDLEYFDWGGWEDPIVIDDPDWGNWDDWGGDWTDWSDDWTGDWSDEWTWDENVDWDVIFGDCPGDPSAHDDTPADGESNARRGRRGARRGR